MRLEPLEHRLDQAAAGRRIGHRGEVKIDCSSQEPAQLLEGEEFRIVHIDHHAVMIDPNSSLQALSYPILISDNPQQAHVVSLRGAENGLTDT